LEPNPEMANLVTQHMKEESRVLVSVDGPDNNVIKLKPPLCWRLEDANLFLCAFESAVNAVLKSD
jgi:ethanolamine-phosphate phospho-lyase